MPSQAFVSFEYNLVDVERLAQSHAALKKNGRDSRGLGHITRSAVVMLCASWELYLEMLILESVTYYCSNHTIPTTLPGRVCKELSKSVRDAKHELRPLHLAGDGWKTVYGEHSKVLTDGLNSPKSAPVNELFLRLLGVDNLSNHWKAGVAAIDAFVSVRGEIAHRGRHADHVRMGDLSKYRQTIRSAVVDTDNYVSDFLRDHCPARRKPWNVTRIDQVHPTPRARLTPIAADVGKS
jgi:hypothetical protein